MKRKTSVIALEHKTLHKVVQGDARDLSFIPRESVHFVCTSPPYADLIRYPESIGQLGNIASYETFLDEMAKFWAETLRVFVAGGRVACIIGDVCISSNNAGH